MTISELSTYLAMLVALGGSIAAIVAGVKKAIKPMLKPLEEKIDAVDMETCKNFLVHILAEIEHGGDMDEIEIERFREVMEHYTKLGGNSYIKAKIKRLEEAGKL